MKDDAGSIYPVVSERSEEKKTQHGYQKHTLTMRVPIRVQLALLVLLTSMLALAVVSISTVSAMRGGHAGGTVPIHVKRER